MGGATFSSPFASKIFRPIIEGNRFDLLLCTDGTGFRSQVVINSNSLLAGRSIALAETLHLRFTLLRSQGQTASYCLI